MAFKEVLSLDAEKTITIGGFNKKTKTDNPLSAEGYYLGSRVVKGSKFGDSTLHYLQTAEGNLGIWGKTDLNRKLSTVVPGTMIEIKHAGMTPTPNGDMHKYKVRFDEDNTIDVGNLGSASSSSNDDSNGGYEPEDDDQDLVEEATPIRNTSGPSAAERMAKAKEILKRKSS